MRQPEIARAMSSSPTIGSDLVTRRRRGRSERRCKVPPNVDGAKTNADVDLRSRGQIAVGDEANRLQISVLEIRCTALAIVRLTRERHSDAVRTDVAAKALAGCHIRLDDDATCTV